MALRTRPWEQKVNELFCAPLEKNKKKRKVKIKGYTGELVLEIITTTIPQQWHKKCLLVFLSISERIRKRTDIPL